MGPFADRPGPPRPAPPGAESALWWRLLGWSFLFGGLWDLAFGLGILTAQDRLAPLLGITLPVPQVYVDLNGLLLIALAMVYFLVFSNPRRFAPVAVVATLLRYAGAALFTAELFLGRAEPAFGMIAKADAAFALVHTFLLHKAAGSLVAAFVRSHHGD